MILVISNAKKQCIDNRTGNYIIVHRFSNEVTIEVYDTRDIIISEKGERDFLLKNGDVVFRAINCSVFKKDKCLFVIAYIADGLVDPKVAEHCAILISEDDKINKQQIKALVMLMQEKHICKPFSYILKDAVNEYMSVLTNIQIREANDGIED